MRAVVTGAAGFLGSHLCDFLREQEWDVVGLDDLSTGSLENLAGLRQLNGFSFVRQDVVEALPVAGPVDWVLHFASPASPRDYLERPLATLDVGALGTRNALRLALVKGARFLVASTSEVYGDPLVHPQTEEYWGNVNSVGPRSVYDESKRFAEAITMAYHRQHGLDTRIIRIFNTFGPRMRLHDGRAVPQFMTQALAGEPVTVYGDGSQTRSFQYVSDLVEGVWLLMHSSVTEPVNIGNPEELTLLEMAQRIIELTGSRSSIVFRPLPADDPRLRRPDITRARTRLGWEPRISTDEGLRLTVEWFAERLDRPSLAEAA